MGPIIVRAIILRGPAAWGQLGLAHSAWQSWFGYTRLNVGLRRRHFKTTLLSVGRNDCAKGRFGLRGLSDQHVAQRRLKVGVVTAAVNMMTFGSARMSRQRRPLSHHQLRTLQGARRRRRCCHAVTSPNYAVVECEEVRCSAVSERFGDVSHAARALR